MGDAREDTWQPEYKWFISREILALELDDATAAEPITVWENWILIKADSPEEAYKKAIENGRMEEQERFWTDDDKRREGHMRFVGLKDLLIICDDLEDGAELVWNAWVAPRTELETLVRAKEDLHAFSHLAEKRGNEREYAEHEAPARK